MHNKIIFFFIRRKANNKSLNSKISGRLAYNKEMIECSGRMISKERLKGIKDKESGVGNRHKSSFSALSILS